LSKSKESSYKTTRESYLKTYLTTPPRMIDAVSLSLKQRRPGSVADMFEVCCANGFQFASHLGDLRFCSSDWLVTRLNSWDHFFFTFFKTSQTFGLGVIVKAMVKFIFCIYCISTKSTAFLSCIIITLYIL